MLNFKWRALRCSVIAAMVAVAIGNGPAAADVTARAREILDVSNVRGGLIVHLGCGDAALAAALRADEQYVVHGLDANRAVVEKARRAVASQGAYGPVSISLHTGARLPYADNMVRLLVVGKVVAGLTATEIERVLAPRGARRDAIVPL